MKVDLAKVNEKLKSHEKRTHQSVAPVSKEFKELAAKKARLEAQVGQLERDARKLLGGRPAVAKASKMTTAEAEEVSLVRRPAKTMGAIPKHLRNGGKKI